VVEITGGRAREIYELIQAGKRAFREQASAGATAGAHATPDRPGS
jgi:hypothetical protein